MTAPQLSTLRRILCYSRNALASVLISAGLVQVAFAGSAASQSHALLFSISDSSGQVVETQNVSSLLSDFNASTGDLSTVPVGTPLSGNWSWSNIDVANGQILAQKVLTWHSDATTPEGIWQSVVQLKATGNVDPFMSYSFSAKNNTSLAQTFTFSYGESIVPPISGNYSIYADVAGSLTHGAISPIAQLTPTFGDLDGDGISEIQTLRLSKDGGLTLFNAGVDVGLAQSRSLTGTTVFGPVAETITGILSSPVDYWQFDVAFTLTPGKDAAALSGYAEITSLAVIPEPSFYAALMGSTVLLGASMFRRRLAAA